jgi:hypothetical protein
MQVKSRWRDWLLIVVCAIGHVSAAAAPGDGSRVLRVGPGETFQTIGKAAANARDGDVIEVAAGDYRADVAVWTQDRIAVRGVGGRARLIAAGASAEQKAIWVVRGGRMVVENIEFVGARVSDRNGAGIRLEKGSLTVRNCAFLDNENGILAGNGKTIELTIEGSEFGHNGAGDGLSHNLYAGAIARLTVTGSYFHHARVGHLLKSRAAENRIMYNRLTDEIDGVASYELEFPNGGLAYVIGNIIQQAPDTGNPTMISVGAEGYSWPRNEVFLVNNTLVDDRKVGGIFLWVRAGVQRLGVFNNLLIGLGSLETAGRGEYAGNSHANRSALSADFVLTNPIRFAADIVDPGSANGIPLIMAREYVHPAQTRELSVKVSWPGAQQRPPQ